MRICPHDGEERAAMAIPNPPLDLGELILKANPYKLKPSDSAPSGFELMLDDTEKENYSATWSFRGNSLRIAKAIRVSYCFKDADGVEIKEALLIGYEGAGPG